MSPEPTLYAHAPADRSPLGECLFYHTIDLPELGLQHGQWDLRPGVDEYLGNLDFEGLGVLEIGTANGFVCFELERRGAHVTAVDLPALATYDTRPGAGAHDIETMRTGLERIRNAYWLAHSLHSSSARVVYSHVNDLPSSLPRADVVLLANVLQHCRDPVGAVASASRFADVMVVTESEWIAGEPPDAPQLILLPPPSPFSWFQVTPPLVVALLTELGYDTQRVTRHEQLLLEDVDYETGQGKPRRWDGRPVPHFTVVGSRSSATA